MSVTWTDKEALAAFYMLGLTGGEPSDKLLNCDGTRVFSEFIKAHKHQEGKAYHKLCMAEYARLAANPLYAKKEDEQ